MKHLYCLFFVFLLISMQTLASFQEKLVVRANSECYAQVLMDNVYLYRTATESEILENKYFIIDRTYFVELLSIANNIFYQAKYRDTKGYIKIQEVQCVKEVPNKPYLDNINFRVYGESSMKMKSTPTAGDDDQSFVAFLPKYSYATYYGEIIGEAYTLNRTTKWYYAKYTNEHNQTNYGYIYSDNTDEMPPKKLNDEIMTFTNTPTFMIENTQVLQNEAKNVIIILLSIPTLIFVFMIVRGSAILYTNKTAKEKSNHHEIGEF